MAALQTNPTPDRRGRQCYKQSLGRAAFFHRVMLIFSVNLLYNLSVVTRRPTMLLKQKGLFHMAIEVTELTQANQQFAAAFDQGGLAMPPARKLAVITCMDARLEPLSFLGLRLGDAHIIRNAGGRASPDAIRSLVISQQLLGTDAVLVIHHTDCGMLTFQNDDLRGILKERLGAAAHQTAAEIDFLPFSDLAQSVRDDVATIKNSPLFPKHIPIYGFIYDVRSGRLERIE